MNSAFGVDHGEVSKGLPRYLRDITPSVMTGPSRQFRGGAKRPISRDDYSYLRVKANQSGKTAARQNAEWKKIPKTLEGGNIGRAEKVREKVVESATRGKIAREFSRRPITQSTKRKLP